MKIIKIIGIIDFTMTVYYKTITRKQAEAILFNVKIHKGFLDVKHSLNYENGSYYFKLDNGQILNIERSYDKNLTAINPFTLSPLGFIRYEPQLKLFNV